ncbi:MAG: hypothetical protein UX12_C0002G0009 [Candidatus Collierbacteria bacterium GW2011_GWC1_45_47]|uniref:Uncharacterized protein n=6 Tax=Candidatus Collieribacteriota TaxID=1752725 RepID=A0A0G1HKE9_9BACT|nr:MAG: hypothetical protein UW23_C0011G0009 [Candidatus Collierbacteria bacterium GW2011_GWA1_44_12]KKT39548.1 MAG: hypothetical protein UW26_C0001G0035 [Candidatus Collierbacteria bacterium GW2011_GWF1_44_12]KKT47073.1 MAG: hypothetical protein UW35_C0003G0010 [Candidatus Collierbacteria bacterium GW2011_GWF2_44_15]KKT68047.1 MAG: hypothetical protein UW62_C0006G0006 [Candidatus Collierbacteria bacterium GW2011_GWB1_44_35]KKT99112.1 MAG: hypothetical protein UW99_C0009G0006 [Candidatus Collie
MPEVSGIAYYEQMTKRKKLTIMSEHYHGQMHFLFGLLAWVFGMIIFGGDQASLLIVALLGAYIPDADHLLFIFWYGRQTRYAIEVRECLLGDGLLTCIDYIKKNHKGNTKILSHNMLFVALAMFLSSWFVYTSQRLWGVFFLSWSLHYIFDILEDLLFFGKLNGNWRLRFGK